MVCVPVITLGGKDIQHFEGFLVVFFQKLAPGPSPLCRAWDSASDGTLQRLADRNRMLFQGPGRSGEIRSALTYFIGPVKSDHLSRTQTVQCDMGNSGVVRATVSNFLF